MRLRNVKNANIIIENSLYIVSNPTDYKGKWNSLFNNDNPIHIEIGMGKGKFIIDNAIKYPDINFIGLEKYSSVIARSIGKIGDANIPNLKLICIDALNISDIFDKEIDTIYLNFSDPWPKDRHAKRRLTSDIFLSLYERVFKSDYKIIMKTDNYNLYVYSKEQFIKHNYEIKISSFNKNNIPLNNIMTEYENRFLNLGNEIYKIDAIKRI
jgi:tRNA (guanine-N7-)-methyltransferase